MENSFHKAIFFRKAYSFIYEVVDFSVHLKVTVDKIRSLSARNFKVAGKTEG